MSQSISRVLLHIIFSTKDRLPIIPSDLEKTLHAYIAGIIRNEKQRLIESEGQRITFILPALCQELAHNVIL